MKKTYLMKAIMVFSAILITLQGFGQDNPFITINKRSGSFYKNCEEMYPMVMNYRVVMVRNELGEFHTSPHPGYCEWYSDCNTFSCGLNNSNWKNQMVKHLEKIKSLGCNMIRLCGLDLKYYDTPSTYGNLRAHYIQYMPNNDTCYKADLDTSLVAINVNNYDLYGDMIQEVIDVIKSSELDLNIILLAGTKYLEKRSNEYANYLGYLANRFKEEPLIFAYDLYNEPGIRSSTAFGDKYTPANYFADWYNAVRQQTPSQFVTIGSHTGDVFHWDPKVFPVDFVSLHLYPRDFKLEPYVFSRDLIRFKALLKWFSTEASFPWIIGETGFPATSDTGIHPVVGSLAEQKVFADSSALYSKWLGGKGYSWWWYKDVLSYSDTTFLAQENYFGMVERNLNSDPEQHKPSGESIINFNPNDFCNECINPTDDEYYDPYQFETIELYGHVEDENGLPVRNAFVTSLFTRTQEICQDSTLELEQGSITFTDYNGYYYMRVIPDPEGEIKTVNITYPGKKVVSSTTWGNIPVPFNAVLEDLDSDSLPEKPDYTELIITDNVVWDFMQSLPYEKVIIEPGASLTITGKTFMAENSKIIVKPNGMLTIDGGMLKSSCDFWQGIEVWGNSAQHQYEIDGERQQGMVVLQDSAIIMNAFNAITLWEPENFSKTGGIVWAEDSYFYNNRRSVEFISYHNYYPGSLPDQEVDNLSYFKNCTFMIDKEYFSDDPFYAHATLWDVKGVKFIGCHFSNLHMLNEGKGIYSLDANYRLTSFCESTSNPCPEENLVRNTFKRLYIGIHAQNSLETDYTVYVNEAHFIRNSFGIKLESVKYPTVLNSIFNVAFEPIEGGYEQQWAIGIDLNDCHGYAIEENEFYGNFPSPPPFSVYSLGIRAHNRFSTHYENEIYNNDFQQLYQANCAEENNAHPTQWEFGLSYLCNQNQGNKYDFMVSGLGIREFQGSFSEAAGNTFTQSGLVDGGDFHNENAEIEVDYFYYDDPGAYEQEPVYFTNKFDTTGIENSNDCESHYGGGSQGGEDRGLSSEELLQLEQEFYGHLNNYQNVEALYHSLLDGGNTDALKAEINTSWPDDMWQLRSKLLGFSPHLSDEVLMAASDKTDVLPDTVLLEILVANPEELKKDTLIHYLEQKTNPLPEYMIAILEQVATSNMSYKSVLKSQMGDFNRKKSYVGHRVIRNILNDSISDASLVRNWLDNMQGIGYDHTIIDTWLQEGDIAPAMGLLNMLPQLYDMTPEQLEAHNDYTEIKLLQMGLMNENRNIYQLDSIEIALLEQKAANGKGVARKQAQHILEFVYGYSFAVDTPFIIPEDTAGYKSFSPLQEERKSVMQESSIRVFPNPAKQWAAFEYSMATGEKTGVLQVTDTRGNVIFTREITGPEGQTIWDAREVNPGMYYYMMKTDGKTISGKIVIVK